MNSTKTTKWIAPAILLIVGALLLGTGVLVSISNREAGDQAVTVTDPSDGVGRVSLEDAFQAHQNGNAVLVDVRSASSFGTAHIPGSLSIPLSEIGTRANELNPDDWVITICA